MSDSPHSKPSRAALRISLILPIIIAIIILIVGAIIFQLFPESQFNALFGILLGGGLILFLIYWTRDANWQLRLLALFFALPALAGITTGVVQGRSRFIVIGVGATFLLLVIQRTFQIPTSYRLATRYFDRADYEQALRLINKSIEARPDFAESYQLRASIRMIYRQFAQAEADAKHAIALLPKQASFYNTLGQIYLAEGNYKAALSVFETAVSLNENDAMHQYHKGLSAYRLGQWAPAAEALSMATKKTLPLIEYDLLAHYYLYQTLKKRKQSKTAQETLEAMLNFKEGLPKLHRLVKDQVEVEHVALLRQDIEALENLVEKEEGTEKKESS